MSETIAIQRSRRRRTGVLVLQDRRDLPAMRQKPPGARPVSHRAARRRARGQAPMRRATWVEVQLRQAGPSGYMRISAGALGPRRLEVAGMTYLRTSEPVTPMMVRGVAMLGARYRSPAGEPVMLLRGVGVHKDEPFIIAGGFLLLT